jgi:hypothetical protein
MSVVTDIDLFGTSPKSKANGNGHRITCRTITIGEADLRMLGIHNAKGASYSVYRRLARKNPALTPSDIAHAVRDVRLMAELWVDEVAASLDRLQPYSLRRGNTYCRHSPSSAKGAWHEEIRLAFRHPNSLSTATSQSAPRSLLSRT